MKMKQLSILFLCALFSMGLQAGEMGKGKGLGAGGGKQYRNLDTNGDGVISEAEIKAHQKRQQMITENWKKADTNNDGKVDVSEFSAFEEKQLKSMEKEQDDD